MDKLAKGLVPLTATVLGVITFVHWVPWWVLMVLCLAGEAGLGIARLMVPAKLRWAAVTISLWMLTGISVMAVITCVLLRLAENAPELFRTDALSQDTLKEVAATFTGAFSTFVGVVLIKDVEEGGGFLWPGTQFKEILSNVFSQPGHTPAADTQEWEAVYEDRVGGHGPRGWGLQARIDRAKILE